MLNQLRRWWRSRCPTPASASRRRSSASSSRRSSRPTPAPAASTAAPASASRSAASSRACSAARSSCAATPGKGSTFTLYLPLKYVGPSGVVRVAPDAPALVEKTQPSYAPPERARSSRSRTTGSTSCPGDSILLIVEDDPHYARVIMDLARDSGFKVLVAMRGADALDLAKQFQPTRGLARRVPARHARLDRAEPAQAEPARRATSRCRSSRSTRTASTRSRAARSPSSPSRPRPRASKRRSRGSRSTREPRRKRLLVVEDNPAEQMSIRELLGHDDIEIDTAGTGSDALASLREQRLRLRRARPAPARHVRLRGAGGDQARRAAVATFRSWCSPAASSRPRRTRSCTPWRAASW